MRKRFESLTARDVPRELDCRILAAAAQEARRIRHRRIFRITGFWSGAAAAAAGVLIGVAVFQHPQPRPEPRAAGAAPELLALADWSTLEQDNFNLSFELDSGNLSVAELAEARIPGGVW